MATRPWVFSIVNQYKSDEKCYPGPPWAHFPCLGAVSGYPRPHFCCIFPKFYTFSHNLHQYFSRIVREYWQTLCTSRGLRSKNPPGDGDSELHQCLLFASHSGCNLSPKCLHPLPTPLPLVYQSQTAAGVRSTLNSAAGVPLQGTPSGGVKPSVCHSSFVGLDQGSRPGGSPTYRSGSYGV